MEVALGQQASDRRTELLLNESSSREEVILVRQRKRVETTGASNCRLRLAPAKTDAAASLPSGYTFSLSL